MTYGAVSLARKGRWSDLGRRQLTIGDHTLRVSKIAEAAALLGGYGADTLIPTPLVCMIATFMSKFLTKNPRVAKMQPCGPGRSLRKRIFVKPYMVRKDRFVGEVEDTSANYREKS